MFPKGFNLGDMGGVLKQAAEMKGKMEELKESLGAERVEASAGGGMVRVVMTGKMELESLHIDPEVLAEGDKEMLETLVKAAVNEGVRKAQALMQEKMAELTGGLNIPGLT